MSQYENNSTTTHFLKRAMAAAPKSVKQSILDALAGDDYRNLRNFVKKHDDERFKTEIAKWTVRCHDSTDNCSNRAWGMLGKLLWLTTNFLANFRMVFPIKRYEKKPSTVEYVTASNAAKFALVNSARALKHFWDTENPLLAYVVLCHISRSSKFAHVDIADIFALEMEEFIGQIIGPIADDVDNKAVADRRTNLNDTVQIMSSETRVGQVPMMQLLLAFVEWESNAIAKKKDGEIYSMTNVMEWALKTIQVNTIWAWGGVHSDLARDIGTNIEDFASIFAHDVIKHCDVETGALRDKVGRDNDLSLIGGFNTKNDVKAAIKMTLDRFNFKTDISLDDPGDNARAYGIALKSFAHGEFGGLVLDVFVNDPTVANFLKRTFDSFERVYANKTKILDCESLGKGNAIHGTVAYPFQITSANQSDALLKQRTDAQRLDASVCSTWYGTNLNRLEFASKIFTKEDGLGFPPDVVAASGAELSAVRARFETEKAALERRLTDLGAENQTLRERAATLTMRSDAGTLAVRTELESARGRLRTAEGSASRLQAQLADNLKKADEYKKDTDAKIANLESEKQTLTSRTRELEADNNRQSTTIGRLLGERTALQQQLDIVKAQKSAEEQRVIVAEGKTREMQTTHDAAIAAKDDSISGLQRENARLNESVSNLQKTVDELNPKLSKAEGDLVGAQQLVTNLQADVARLAANLKEKNRQYADLDSAKEKLADNNRQLQTQVDGLTGQLHDKESEIDRVKSAQTTSESAKDSKISELESEKTGLQTRVGAIEREKASIEGQLQTVRADISRLQSKLTAKEDELKAKVVQLSEVAGQKASADADREAAVASKNQIQQSLDAIEADMTRVAKELADARSALSEKDAAITGLETQLRALEAEKTSAISRKDDVIQRIDNEKAKLQVELGRVKGLARIVSEHESSLERELAAYRQEREATNAELAASMAKVNSLESSIKDLQSQVAGGAAVDARLQTATAEIEVLTRRATTAEASVEDKTRELAAKQTELDRLNVDQARTKSELDRASEEVRVYEQHVENISQKIRDAIGRQNK